MAVKPITKKRNKLKPKKSKPKLVTPGEHSEHDLPRDEEQWLNLQKGMGGPGNPMAIPPGLSGMSERPEATLAWLRANCKFAKRAEDDAGTDG